MKHYGRFSHLLQSSWYTALRKQNKKHAKELILKQNLSSAVESLCFYEDVHRM